MMPNLRRLPLRTRYIIGKEIVTWLGLFEYLGLGGVLFFLGSKDYQESLLSFALMGCSYYISTKLGYRVSEMLVRLQIEQSQVQYAPSVHTYTEVCCPDAASPAVQSC